MAGYENIVAYAGILIGVLIYAIKKIIDIAMKILTDKIGTVATKKDVEIVAANVNTLDNRLGHLEHRFDELYNVICQKFL